MYQTFDFVSLKSYLIDKTSSLYVDRHGQPNILCWYAQINPMNPLDKPIFGFVESTF